MNERIRLVSTLLKWMVILVSVSVVVYLLYSYVVDGDFNFNSDTTLFMDLWDTEDASRSMLMLSTLPCFLLWAVLNFWLYRLFTNFERGDYFSATSMRCYLWLVWTYAIIFLWQFAYLFILAYYHRMFFDDTEFAISLDLSEMFTLFILVSVVHILKAAKQIEEENKEFI